MRIDALPLERLHRSAVDKDEDLGPFVRAAVAIWVLHLDDEVGPNLLGINDLVFRGIGRHRRLRRPRKLGGATPVALRMLTSHVPLYTAETV